MRILIVNKYHKLTGGADRYAMDLARLLQEHGHAVAFVAMDQPDNWPAEYPLYTIPSGLTNATWERATSSERLTAFVHGIYHRGAAATVTKAIAEFRPDVVHCQNLFYQVSPSAIHAARKAGVPVVQTLHDYQPVCANNVLHARGHICEACRRRRFHSILINRCYNDSASASILAFSAKVAHTALGLYPGGVQRFISPSEFLKAKIESFDIPMAPIEHVNNFLDPSNYEPAFEPGEYLLFFGQLLKHKGVYTLLDALSTMRHKTPAVIVGTGPEEAGLERAIAERGLSSVRLAGYKKGEELFEIVRRARMVVVPSEWYENQPYAVLESMALGKPVIGAAIGGIPELIDETTGMLFAPGDAADLAAKADSVVDDDGRLRAMGHAALRRVLECHDPHGHVTRLRAVYRDAGAAGGA